MGNNNNIIMGRRALLAGVASGLATSSMSRIAGGDIQSNSQFVLVQGDRCVQIRPINGRVTVKKFYNYHLPAKYASDENGAIVGNPKYVSAGTTDLQRANTSLTFLYRGPKGLSLVFIHGSVRHPGGGAATFRISGLSKDGKWVVKDDYYRDPATGERADSNYDWWRVNGTTHRIDWTWGDSGTDGGAFRALGKDFMVTVLPAFNEAATLYERYYEGKITDWQFLSGGDRTKERISLDLSQPIRITTGECPDRDN